MEPMYDHIFKEKLNMEDTSGQFVLCTEMSMNPRANREKLIQIMVETYNVGGFYLASAAVMSLLESGRTSGYVLESGHGCTMPVPVYEGHYIPHAVMKVNTSGYELRFYLDRSLSKHNSIPTTEIEYRVLADIKKLFFVSMDYKNELEKLKASPAKYQLPDGETITIEEERCVCPEVYFDPEIVGDDRNGIHKTIFQSIQKCDKDLHELFYKNIVLGGGSTLFPGFPERLESELRQISGYKGEIKVTPSTGILSAWRGACILAKSSAFPSMVLTKADYEEHGPALIHKMCF